MYIAKVNSTNSYLLSLPNRNALEDYFTVYTYNQTAGRGQQGNTWDSQPGKNLLFSILVHPLEVPVERQFMLTQWVAVSLTQVLQPYASDVCIKWPNDIYVGDCKLGGVLIENELSQKTIANTVIGIGINVNQSTFRPDLLNPISLRKIVGQNVSKKALLDAFLQQLKQNRPLLSDGAQLKSKYMAHLYRKTGFHKYVEVLPSVAPLNISRDDTNAFLARTVDIDAFGRILLEDTSHRQKQYHFKEIKIVL